MNLSLPFIFKQPGTTADLTQVYAIIPFLNVLFTYGMETAYFRFSQEEERKHLYSTLSLSIFFSTILFSICLYSFRSDISNWAGLDQHPQYIMWACWILFFDTLATLPFAVWLFLAIEQLPLAAEESTDPKRDMPKGLIYGMSTLMASALLITFLNSGIGSMDADKMHGAFSLSTSGEPLLDGFRVIYGTGLAKLLAFLAVIGLIASFHTIIYAYGRQIYSLSRAGYYLGFMSITHHQSKVPHMALYTGTAIGFLTMLAVWFIGGSEKSTAFIGGTLLNMAVFGAMISYAMQGISFILLRRNLPNIERPDQFNDLLRGFLERHPIETVQVAFGKSPAAPRLTRRRAPLDVDDVFAAIDLRPVQVVVRESATVGCVDTPLRRREPRHPPRAAGQRRSGRPSRGDQVQSVAVD